MRLIIFIIALLLSACANTARMTGEAAYLKTEIQSGRVTENIKRADLTPARSLR